MSQKTDSKAQLQKGEATSHQTSPLPDSSPYAGHEEELREMGYDSRVALKRLRRAEKLTYEEIAEIFDVSEHTIGKYCRKYDIGGGPNWDGTFNVENVDGYPSICVDGRRVVIHQLVVIADGADPYKVFGNDDYSVHHKNGIKVDNRPSNLELLPISEHSAIDAKKQAKYKASDLMAVVEYMLNPARWEDNETE